MREREIRSYIKLLPAVGVLLFALQAGGQETMRQAISIPQQPLAKPVPAFIGSPAVPKPISATPVPESPYMAPNGRSGTHVDAYQSDTYSTAGPLGRSTKVTSTFLAAECGTVTFDKQGRILVVCVGVRPVVYLLDPVTLETLARYPLPAGGTGGTFGAGGYFFLDQFDRAVIPTRTRDIWRIKVVDTAAGPKLVQDHTCSEDLPPTLPSDQAIQSVFPDSHGLLWFTTSGGSDPTLEPALVGTLTPDASDPNHCVVQISSLPQGEAIAKSFAVDPDPSRGGVFVVSDYRLYRFDADNSGTPTVTWYESYDRGSGVKPGQKQQGSGTTPTLMGTEFVTINDNADPQTHVNVYRRSAHTNKARLVCSEAVFPPGMSASFNSLIATQRSITIENNYGDEDLTSTIFGRTTVPSITRIDVDPDGAGCHTVWNNEKLSVPNVVSQMSLANGLEYTYTKGEGPGFTDAWYFTAVDFHTGRAAFQVLAGTGVLYNSNYSAVYLGPDGKTAYVGVLAGLLRIHDEK